MPVGSSWRVGSGLEASSSGALVVIGLSGLCLADLLAAFVPELKYCC